MTTWKCKDGRILNICDMTDDHIVNAIRMLLRKGYVTCDDYMESFDNMVLSDLSEISCTRPVLGKPTLSLDHLQAEARKRGLRW